MQLITVGSLFSGIGGIELGLERTGGFKTVWQVENDPYAQKVLRKHWPDVRRWDDVRTFPPDADTESVSRQRTGKKRARVCVQDNSITNGQCRESGSDIKKREPNRRIADWCYCQVIVGGFPCQPVSCAGRRQAQSDPRWLWPEFARIIRTLRPQLTLLENVPGLFVHGFGDVLRDLAEMGHDAEWCVLPACAFGAPHPRERIFVIAYPGSCRQTWRNERASRRRKHSIVSAECVSVRHQETAKGKTSANGNGNEARMFRPGREVTALPRPCWGSDQPGVVRASYGVSNRVHRIAALGNAVVPQVAQWIGERILEAIAQHDIHWQEDGNNADLAN